MKDNEEEDTFYAHVRTAIRTARQTRGLSQIDLAKKLSIPRMRVAHIEAGNQKVSLYLVYKIASALNVKPGTLIAGNVRQQRGKVKL